MEKNARLLGVLSHSIDLVWEEALPFIKDACEYSDGKYLPDDIYTNLKYKNMQLWLVYTNDGLVACVVTQIINYPRQKRLCILFCGGIEMQSWLHLIESIFAFGREHECESCEIYGRPGWERALKKYGMEKIHIVLKAQL